MMGYCLNCAEDSAPMHLCYDLCWQCCEHGVSLRQVVDEVEAMLRAVGVLDSAEPWTCEPGYHLGSLS